MNTTPRRRSAGTARGGSEPGQERDALEVDIIQSASEWPGQYRNVESGISAPAVVGTGSGKPTRGGMLPCGPPPSKPCSPPAHGASCSDSAPATPPGRAAREADAGRRRGAAVDERSGNPAGRGLL